MYKLITLLGIYFITGNSIIFIVWPVSGWIRIIKTVKNNNPFPDNMVQINKTVDKTLTYITKVTDISLVQLEPQKALLRP